MGIRIGRVGVVGLAVAAAVGAGLPFASPTIRSVVMVLVAAFAIAMVIATRFGIERLLFSVMALNVFLVPMNSLELGPLMNLSDGLLAAGATILLAMRLAQPGGALPPQYRKFLSSFALIAFGGVVATSLAVNPTTGLPDVLRFVLSTMGVLWLLAAWAPDQRTVRLLIWVFALGVSVSALVGLGGATAYPGRSVGLANHPNHFGATCLFGFGSTVALAVSSVSRTGRRTAYGLSALLALGVVQSGSRSALLAILVAVAVLLVALGRIRLFVQAAVIGVLLIVGVATTASRLQLPAVERLFLDPSDAGVEASNREREALIKQTLTKIDERPLVGSGFDFALEAHSLYLQIWVSAGLIGLLGMARILYWSGRLLHRSRLDVLSAGLMATFVGFLANGVFSPILWDRYIWTFLALALAVVPVGAATGSFILRTTPDEPVVPDVILV